MQSPSIFGSVVIEFFLTSDSSKLIEQIGLMPEGKRPKIMKADSTLATTKLDSLLIRINEPYYMLHHGNCEHFIVVDQIR